MDQALCASYAQVQSRFRTTCQMVAFLQYQKIFGSNHYVITPPLDIYLRSCYFLCSPSLCFDFPPTPHYRRSSRSDCKPYARRCRHLHCCRYHRQKRTLENPKKKTCPALLPTYLLLLLRPLLPRQLVLSQRERRVKKRYLRPAINYEPSRHVEVE